DTGVPLRRHTKWKERANVRLEQSSFCVGASDGRVRTQPAYNRHEVAGPVGQCITRVVVQREPDLRLGGRETELRRHHANNFSALALDLNEAPDDRRIASETFCPQLVTQDDVVVLAGRVFTGAEYATKFRRCSQHGKELGRDLGRG